MDGGNKRTHDDVLPACDGSEHLVVRHLTRKVYVRVDAKEHLST